METTTTTTKCATRTRRYTGTYSIATDQHNQQHQQHHQQPHGTYRGHPSKVHSTQGHQDITGPGGHHETDQARCCLGCASGTRGGTDDDDNCRTGHRSLEYEGRRLVIIITIIPSRYPKHITRFVGIVFEFEFSVPCGRSMESSRVVIELDDQRHVDHDGSTIIIIIIIHPYGGGGYWPYYDNPRIVPCWGQ